MDNEPTTAADRTRWFALAILLTATLLDLLDATIVNIALPSIQHDLNASFTAVQWVAAGYTLAFAVLLITGGRLGDIAGRKRVFLWSMAAFTLASVLSGIAPSAETLIGARVLQGLAAALMVPQVLSIIAVSFPQQESGKVFGIFGAVCGIGAVSGPVVGALLLSGDVLGLGWRPIFLVNLPIGLVALYLGNRFITESQAPDKPRLDLTGVVLAATALFLLLFPLTVGRDFEWPAWAFAMMAASVLVFVAFVLQQRRRTQAAESPLVPMSLFRVRSFAAGIGVQATFSITFGLFSLCGALYMQLGLGWSPLRTALTSLFFGATMSVTAIVGIQRLVPKFGTRVLQGGALLMAAGLLIYRAFATDLGPDAQWWQLVLPLVVTGAGLGLIMAPLTQTIMSEVPFQYAGSGSGVINTVSQVGLTVGLSLNAPAFFAVVDSQTGGVATQASGQPVVTAFTSALWWVIAGSVVVFALLFLLPAKPPAPSYAAPAGEDDQAAGDDAEEPAQPVTAGSRSD